MNLCDLDTIRALLDRHGFHFSKSMGQNFLIDPEIPYNIAASSQADKNCGVLEIGPGIGPLTSELAQRAGKVVSIELDKSLLPVLKETMAPYPNVEIVPGDAMKLDLNALIEEKFQGLRPIVCANLPYNITTPILEKFIQTPAIETMTVLIQKEVAQRLAAAQGDSDGGSFSLFLQYYMETEYLFDVPREKFLPAPKVTSAVLRCVRRKKPAVEVEDEAFFEVGVIRFDISVYQCGNIILKCFKDILRFSVHDSLLQCIIKCCTIHHLHHSDLRDLLSFGSDPGCLQIHRYIRCRHFLPPTFLPTPADGQNSRKKHSSHFGLRATQMVLPRVMI